LAIGTANAAEKYDLKTSTPDEVGQKRRIVKSESMRATNVLLDENEKEIESDKKTTENVSDYVETVLAERNKKMTKSSRKYAKAVKKSDDEAQELELDGKTVICDKQNGMYEFSLEGGGKLSNAAIDLLQDEFKNKDDEDEIEKLFLPTNAVAVGETWKCDVKQIAKRLLKDAESDSLDVAKATSSGTLRKVYAKDGNTFGVIDITLEIPVLAIGEAGDMVKADAGSKMTMKFVLDVCIDGKATIGTMTATIDAKITGKIKLGDQTVTIKTTAHIEAKETHEPVK
jgi:hypothetical protein